MAISGVKIKTDQADAHVLAHLLQLDFLLTVWKPDESLSVLRELTARRARLSQDDVGKTDTHELREGSLKCGRS